MMSRKMAVLLTVAIALAVAPVSHAAADWTIKQAVLELIQLNEGQPYAYDRDGLIGLLDEALAIEAN